MTTPRDGFGLDATPEDRIALFELIRDELTNRAIGVSPDVIPRLALIGTQHLAGDGGGRMVLRGPSGSGKSFLARTMGHILGAFGVPGVPGGPGVPVLRISCGMLSEMNWSGSDLGNEVARLFDSLRGGHPSRIAELAARAVVILEDLDHCRLAGAYGSQSTRDYRQGKQQGLAALLKGEAIPGTEHGGTSKSWSGERALIIINARFDGLRDPAAADDISDWGVLPEMAEYLAAAHTFVLAPPAGEALERILLGGISQLSERFTSFGYALHVAPETISYLVRAMSARGSGHGVLQARTRLEQAASTLLLDALERRLPADEVVTLAPDHVVPPPVARGMWRE